MTVLIKVTFTSTVGEETTGQAPYDPSTGLVTLPSRLLSRVQRAKNAGEGFALAAHEDGYRYPLIAVQEGVYHLDRSKRKGKAILSQVATAIVAPTKDQRQQYGRFAHTLSAAAIIAACGYIGSTRVWSVSAITDVLSLSAISVVLFLAGAVLSKGD